MGDKLTNIIHLLVLVVGFLVLSDYFCALALQLFVELGLQLGERVEVEFASQLVDVVAGSLVEVLHGLQEFVLY